MKSNTDSENIYRFFFADNTLVNFHDLRDMIRAWTKFFFLDPFINTYQQVSENKPNDKSQAENSLLWTHNWYFDRYLSMSKPASIPRRFFIKSSNFILLDGLIFGECRSVLSIIIANDKMYTVSAPWNKATQLGLHAAYLWEKTCNLPCNYRATWTVPKWNLSTKETFCAYLHNTIDFLSFPR